MCPTVTLTPHLLQLLSLVAIRVTTDPCQVKLRDPLLLWLLHTPTQCRPAALVTLPTLKLTWVQNSTFLHIVISKVWAGLDPCESRFELICPRQCWNLLGQITSDRPSWNYFLHQTFPLYVMSLCLSSSWIHLSSLLFFLTILFYLQLLVMFFFFSQMTSNP